MKFFYKMERKIGKYAIPGLMKFIIGAYALGYIVALFNESLLPYLTLDAYAILHGEVWRLLTWIVVPSSQFNPLFTLIMLFMYFQLGTTLERFWGTFRFNLYMFGGWFFTCVGAFALHLVFYILGARAEMLATLSMFCALFFSTYYINLSLFLAFALCFPNTEVRLYFILPIKMKWMAIIYAVLVGYDFINNHWAGRTAIFASLLNFIIFFFATRNWKSISPKQVKRKVEFKKSVTVEPGKTRHKCAICGRTEKDDPTLEFRYCSKCDGNYEYCQDHLFTHEHIKRS